MQRKRQPQGFYTMTRTESQKTEPDTDDEEDYTNQTKSNFLKKSIFFFINLYKL